MSKFKSKVLPDDMGPDEEIIEMPTPLENVIAGIENEEEPQESGASEVIHRARPELSPPVTGARMPF